MVFVIHMCQDHNQCINDPGTSGPVGSGTKAPEVVSSNPGVCLSCALYCFFCFCCCCFLTVV